MKEFLKSKILGNVYLLERAEQMIGAKHNYTLKKTVAPLLKIDPISEFDAYQKYIINWKKNVQPGTESVAYNFRLTNLEAMMYGHGLSFFRYAAMEGKAQYNRMPYIEHGVYFIGDYWPIDAHASIITQGVFREEILHKALPQFPMFNVGPFIHYPEPVLSEEEVAEQKRKNGKTLLIFPVHSYELSETSYCREDFVDVIMEKYAKEFDTVLVSAFWNDVADPVFAMFAEKGAKIVSCGFKFDTNFIRRLKTLLLLADATMGNAMGTHIGYSLYLKRPHILIPENSVRLDPEKIVSQSPIGRNVYFEDFSAFWETFSWENYKQGNYNFDSYLYKRYWSGEEHIKTPDEMRAILECNRDLQRIVRGNIDQESKCRAPQLLLEKYLQKNETVKYTLLQSSIKREKL